MVARPSKIKIHAYRETQHEEAETIKTLAHAGFPPTPSILEMATARSPGIAYEGLS